MSGGRNPFLGFGDPFGNFGGPFGNSGGPLGNSGGPFGNSGGLRGFGALGGTSLFGRMDPFNDPFFTNPFGSMSSIFGGSFMNGPFTNPASLMNPAVSGLLEHERPPGSFMNSSASGLLEHERPPGSFMNSSASGFLEHERPLENRSRGPIIEELNSDEEKGENESGQEELQNPRKHARSSNEPFVEFPDDEIADKRRKHTPRGRELNQIENLRCQTQAHSFTFQSSSISYGNGTYYTSSRTRRAGSDGLTFEECKEANSATGQATHRVSRGIHQKGHSVTRKLKSDGHVDTMQTLHNLDEGELENFDESWKGKAMKNLPGLTEGFSAGAITGAGSSSQQRPRRGALALPSTEGLSTRGNLRPRDSGVPLPRNLRKFNSSNGVGSGN